MLTPPKCSESHPGKFLEKTLPRRRMEKMYKNSGEIAAPPDRKPVISAHANPILEEYLERALELLARASALGIWRKAPSQVKLRLS
jgi:hypothetical protein